MSDDRVTPIRQSDEDAFTVLHQELCECRQTLQCAVAALDKVEDECFGEPEIASAAIQVAHRAVERLVILEGRLDGWYHAR